MSEEVRKHVEKVEAFFAKDRYKVKYRRGIINATGERDRWYKKGKWQEGTLVVHRYGADIDAPSEIGKISHIDIDIDDDEWGDWEASTTDIHFQSESHFIMEIHDCGGPDYYTEVKMDKSNVK